MPSVLRPDSREFSVFKIKGWTRSKGSSADWSMYRDSKRDRCHCANNRNHDPKIKSGLDHVKVERSLKKPSCSSFIPISFALMKEEKVQSRVPLSIRVPRYWVLGTCDREMVNVFIDIIDYIYFKDNELSEIVR